MEEEKVEEKVKNLKKIVIIVLSVLIILNIVAVGIWYFICKNKDIQELENELTEKNMQDLKAPVITGIKVREIVEGEALNFIDGIIATDDSDGENGQKQEKNEESKKDNEETKKENKENKKEIEKTKKENETTTITNKKETTNEKSNTIKAESQEVKSNITTQKPKLTGTDTQKKLTNTETKYGVVINTYTTITYNIYSDGSKTVKSTENSTEYDRSHYSATTEELLPEARASRSKYASMINRIIQNTNSYRQEANVNAVENVTNRPDLNLNEQLCVAACVRAVEMAYANKYSHTRPDGRKCFTVASEMGVVAFAENIACGYDGADSVSLCWKYSPAHYKNMINNYYTEIGIGVFELDRVYYWVQLFI